MKRCLLLGCVLCLSLSACAREALPPESGWFSSSAETNHPVIASSGTSPALSQNILPATEKPAGSLQIKPSSSSKAESSGSSQARSANPKVVRVSIPEGFSFYQIARRLEANGVCKAQAFYEAAQHYQVQSFAVPPGGQSCFRLEGFLYPDTYEFYQNDDPVDALRKMLNNYKEKSGLPDYNTLILASIIERETRSATHMAIVSSVYHNRLDQGMRLQADATRAYVEQHIKPAPWVQNPAQYAARYNTYKCKALPAGPICNPGRRAIQAAQNPSQSSYLYYFFGNDNTNHYSVTYDEHKAAMAQYGVQYG